MSELTRQQICATLGVSESTIRRLEHQGLPRCNPVDLLRSAQAAKPEHTQQHRHHLANVCGCQVQVMAEVSRDE